MYLLTHHILLIIICFIDVINYVVSQGGKPGPHRCADRIHAHTDKYLTEFRKRAPGEARDPDEINFLEHGDTCNSNAQQSFETKLLQKFTEMNKNPKAINEEVFIELDKIWNEHRANSVDGTLGNRICNPRRLLGCHQSLKKCVCRPDFNLDGEWAKIEYRGILVQSEETTSIDEDIVINNVTKCKATTICGWEAPWLMYCHIDCIQGHQCIAVGTEDAKLKCIPCDPKKNFEDCQKQANKLSELTNDEHVHLNSAPSTPCNCHYQVVYNIITASIIIFLTPLAQL